LIYRKKYLIKFTALFLIIISLLFTRTNLILSSDDESVIFTVNKYLYKIGGQPFTLDASPSWIQNKSNFLIPLRAFSELLKYSVDWNKTDRIVTLTKDKKTVEINVNSLVITINGKKDLLKSFINKNGRILIDHNSISKIFNVLYNVLIPGKEIEFMVPREEIRITAKNFKLKDINGKEYDLYTILDSKEIKLVILNFWATYCPFCLKELPRFVSLYNDYKDKGILLLGLNTDTSDTEDMRDTVIKEYGINYPVLLDINSEIYDLYSVSGVPNLFVIDKNKEIILHHLGSNEEYLDYLKDFLNKYLSQK
jgi:peroxiredoxin